MTNSLALISYIEEMSGSTDNIPETFFIDEILRQLTKAKNSSKKGLGSETMSGLNNAETLSSETNIFFNIPRYISRGIKKGLVETITTYASKASKKEMPFMTSTYLWLAEQYAQDFSIDLPEVCVKITPAMIQRKEFLY